MEYIFTHGAPCVTVTAVHVSTWHIELFGTVLMSCRGAREVNEGSPTLNIIVLPTATLGEWLLIKTFGWASTTAIPYN